MQNLLKLLKFAWTEHLYEVFQLCKVKLCTLVKQLGAARIDHSFFEIVCSFVWWVRNIPIAVKSDLYLL